MFCERRWIPNPATLNGLFNSWKIHHFDKDPPIAKGPAITSGARLIKADGPKVYLHSNGKKFWIQDPATFNRFNFDWKKIETLHVKDFGDIPSGSTISMSDPKKLDQETCPYEGSMIRQDGTAPVYLVMLCKKRWIPNPPTLDGLFNSWKIVNFPKLPALATGPAITNGAQLIRPSNGPKVYLHTNGKRYWIANPTTFDMFNFDWGKIHVLPAAEVDKIPISTTVNSV